VTEEVEKTLDGIVESATEGRYDRFRNLIRDLCDLKEADEPKWTGVSDSYTPVVDSEMLDTEDEILFRTAKNDGELTIVSALEDLNVKKSTAHEVSNQLIEDGFLDKINSMPKIVKITAEGYDKLIDTPILPLADTDENAENKPIYRLHNVTVRYDVPEAASFEEEWRNKIIKRSKREWEYQEEKETHLGYFSDMTVEFAEGSIYLYIRKPYRGYDRFKLHDEMISDAADFLKELEHKNLRDSEDRLYDDEHLSEFEVVQMEVAIENYPSAIILAEGAKSLEDLNLTELVYKAEDDEQVFVDTSLGKGEIEGTGMGVRGRIDGLWRLTKNFWLHSKTWISLPSRTANLEERTSQIEETSEKNREILEGIKELLETEL
jgi:hypothetical protein